MTAPDLIADLRRLSAEGLCLCSSAHTDWRGVEDLLDRLEKAERDVERVRIIAGGWLGFDSSHPYGDEILRTIGGTA